MPTIYYRPAEAIRWLGAPGSEGMHQREVAKKAVDNELGPRVWRALESALAAGKDALGNVDKKAADSMGYVLTETHLEFESLTKKKSVSYESFNNIVDIGQDKFRIDYEGGNIIISPPAHLVAGRMRAPIGWSRNGTEVPYRLLLEELSARSGVEIVAE